MDINHLDSNSTPHTYDDDAENSGRVTEHADDAPAAVGEVDGIDKSTESEEPSQYYGSEESKNYGHIPMNNDNHDKQINANCIDKLCKGMVHNIIPDLEKAKVSVDEALRNQEVLIETVQQENIKFVDCASMGQLVEMMHEAKSYYNKLMTVKRDMNLLSDKTLRLKRRAVKLQQQKQKEEQYLIQRRERELEKEQQLIARVAKKSDSALPANASASNTV